MGKLSSCMIQLKEVSFGYTKEIININKLTLEFDSFGIFGLLGHNGAGKTTLFKLLLNLIETNSGNIYFDENLYYTKDKVSISYMPENNGLYESLTVMQNIKFRGRANGLSKKEIKDESEKLLKRFSLLNKSNEKVQNLSNGMKKKVALIATLITKPKVILLDEPTNGINPESLLEIIDIVKELKKYKSIVIISSHDLQFIQRVADEIFILEEGHLVYKGKDYSNENPLIDIYMKKLVTYREGE